MVYSGMMHTYIALISAVTSMFYPTIIHITSYLMILNTYRVHKFTEYILSSLLHFTSVLSARGEGESGDAGAPIHNYVYPPNTQGNIFTDCLKTINWYSGKRMILTHAS
jgi:hypothetical protein